MKLIFLHHEVGVGGEAESVIDDPADHGRCGDFALTPVAQQWCREHIGHVDIQSHNRDGRPSCELGFASEGDLMLFAIHFDVMFAVVR